jgi:hypothetical protein
MPVDDPDVPTESVWFDLSKPIGSVASVPASGTEYEPMKDRAAKLVDHSLRVLRVALREHNVVPDELLRFRRGTSYSFGGRIAGARRRPGEGWNLDLSDDLVSLAASQPVSAIEVEPASDVRRQAHLALRWIERGMFAADPLESLLFYFFALEALLGRKSEGLKTPGLTFRRAMLSVAIRGEFSDPDRIYYLYETVRSAAVHGAEPLEVSSQEAKRFAWDVRHALNEYLEYADTKGFKKRGRLLAALDKHPERQELVEWLRANSREPSWEDFPTAPN